MEVLLDTFSKLLVRFKSVVILNLFWGRTSFYKKLVHSFVLLFSVTILITGFSVSNLTKSIQSNFFFGDISYYINQDILYQGNTIETVLTPTTMANFLINRYIVSDGETFESISKKFGVTVESIKLSNLKVISYYEENPKVGDELLIPDINGVLIYQEEDSNLEDVFNTVKSGDKRDVIEINNLKLPDFSVKKGQYILIPDGVIDIPQNLNLGPRYQKRLASNNNSSVTYNIDISLFNNLSFVDPLSHPDCSGYFYSRGFTSWHNGVDLAKDGGCPIRSVEEGVVYFAGWSGSGEGYYVGIDHGNNIKSMYFHGDGNIWVSVGQSVAKGQELMYMGCTGWCTGTHLHFSLKYNDTFVDSSSYVPYSR